MRISKFLFSSSLLLGGLWHAGISHAATFNVTNGTELQTALTTAQNNGQGDTINLAVGFYDASTGTFSYTADNTLGSEENFPLSIVGPTAGTATIDGGSINQGMILITNSNPQDNNSDITVQNLTFQNGKSATSGGGLETAGNNADFLIENSIFQDNDSSSGGGALIESIDEGNITIRACSFFRNTSSNFAGGVSAAATGSGNIVFDANLVTDNNESDEGGGVFLDGDQGNVLVTNNIISGNTSLTDNAGGGGIQIVGLVGGATLINNTIVNNQSGTVGGGVSIFTDAPGAFAQLYNNILFGNTATGDGDDLFIFDDAGNPAGELIDLFNNDVANFTTDCTVGGGCTPNINQGANGNFNPALIDPAIGNFNLSVGSQAIDAGSASAPQLPTTDFAGNPRIIGDAPDMGALEALPNIEVNPTSLNFGTVALGESNSLPLTLTNTGAGGLEILDGILSDNLNYSLNLNSGANPCGAVDAPLANGESCTAAVVFGPQSNGTINATLNIVSNDPDSPSLIVPLTGAGAGFLINGGGCSLGAAGTGISWVGLSLFLLALAAGRRLR